MTATKESSAGSGAHGRRITLPTPSQDAGIPIERALRWRRSIRDFTGAPLSLVQVSSLLWAAQGITSPEGFRTAPSAGALYPLEVYLVVGDISELAEGVYAYHPREHALEIVAAGDRRRQLSDAAFSQDWIRSSAAIIVLAAVARRTTRKYGERGHRYVHMEAGHAAQNVYLQAVSLGLGTTTVGAFDDARVKAVLEIPGEARPLCLLPIGGPA
jgi:SagB-type dehydrogenase family enzyme